MQNARAIQSVAMSAVMALSGWLLVVENDGVSVFSQSSVYAVVPQSQSLLSSPPAELDIQVVAIGETVRQSIAKDAWAYFSVRVPAHAKSLNIRLASADGDSDLYVREGSAPIGDNAHGGWFDASSAVVGSQIERVSLSGAGDKVWFVGVHGYHAGSFELIAEIN